MMQQQQQPQHHPQQPPPPPPPQQQQPPQQQYQQQPPPPQQQQYQQQPPQQYQQQQHQQQMMQQQQQHHQQHQHQQQQQQHQGFDFHRGPPHPPMRQSSASSTNMNPEYHHHPPGPPHHPHPPAPYDAHGDNYGKKGQGRKVHRKVVDYTSTVVRYMQIRMWQRDSRDRTVLQPTPAAAIDMLPTIAYADNPSTSFAAKFVHASTNKNRCPINRVVWTPTGRRLITGSQSGEFTLWNGQSFNFELIIQAHDQPIRSMIWSHNENWMVSGDDGGSIKYWQNNMNNVKANKSAHKESVRDLSFCRTDLKFCSCSDDTTVKVWDFARCQEDRTLTGHGWDVKSVDWHPTKSLLVSGVWKDNLVKLWDAKTGKELSSFHGHKNTVLSVKWNENGNWILTASKDQIIKLYDIRAMKELQSFRGHQKDVTDAVKGGRVVPTQKDSESAVAILEARIRTLENELMVFQSLFRTGSSNLMGCLQTRTPAGDEQRKRGDTPEKMKVITALAWHPFHEEYFVSGSYDGSIYHWLVGHENPQVELPGAHEDCVWDLAWHPIGYLLCSGSSDHTTRFWCRNRPGDPPRNNFNMGYNQGYAEQNPPFPGRQTGNFPMPDAPPTPGPFSSGVPRNEGTIPGIGVAMPMSVPGLDSSEPGEQKQPLLAPPLPPGPHPSLLAPGQQAYQQIPQQMQSHQQHQSFPPHMPSLGLPPNLPQLQPPSHMPFLPHAHLPRPPPQLGPGGMPPTIPSSMPGSMAMPSSMATSLPLQMPVPMGMQGSVNQMGSSLAQGQHMGVNPMHSGSVPNNNVQPPSGGFANGIANSQAPPSGLPMYPPGGAFNRQQPAQYSLGPGLNAYQTGSSSGMGMSLMGQNIGHPSNLPPPPPLPPHGSMPQ